MQECRFCQKSLINGENCNCFKNQLNINLELQKKGLKICEYCKKEIELNSNICIFCGKKQTSSLVILVLLAIMVISIGTLTYFIYISPSNSINTETNTDITSGSCDYYMKEEIRNQYKSPSTVNFISCNWDKTKGVSGEIRGEADSQNGFGAIIRSSFVCSGNSCVIVQR